MCAAPYTVCLLFWVAKLGNSHVFQSNEKTNDIGGCHTFISAHCDKFLFFHLDKYKKMASLNLKGCMILDDQFPGFSKDLFLLPKHYEDCIDRLLIPGGLIQVKKCFCQSVAEISRC